MIAILGIFLNLSNGRFKITIFKNNLLKKWVYHVPFCYVFIEVILFLTSYVFILVTLIRLMIQQSQKNITNDHKSHIISDRLPNLVQTPRQFCPPARPTFNQRDRLNAPQWNYTTWPHLCGLQWMNGSVKSNSRRKKNTHTNTFFIHNPLVPVSPIEPVKLRIGRRWRLFITRVVTHTRLRG